MCIRDSGRSPAVASLNQSSGSINQSESLPDTVSERCHPRDETGGVPALASSSRSSRPSERRFGGRLLGQRAHPDRDGVERIEGEDEFRAFGGRNGWNHGAGDDHVSSSQRLTAGGQSVRPVSYTHLTLPT